MADRGSTSEELRRTLVGQLGRFVDLSPGVRQGFATVPREIFLPEVVEEHGLEAVYSDEAIPVKHDEAGAAISSSSQPQIMAAMLEALDVRPGQRILEVGAGTGYNAALLKTLVGDAGRVTTIDVDPEMTARASEALQRGGYDVEVVTGDGREGWKDRAPYDRVIVTASSTDVPRSWLDQLEVGGRLEFPLSLSPSAFQVIPTLQREDDRLRSLHVLCGGFMALRAAGDGCPEVQTARQTSLNARDAQHAVTVTGPSLDALDERARELLREAIRAAPQRARFPEGIPMTVAGPYFALGIDEGRVVEVHRTDGASMSVAVGALAGDGFAVVVEEAGFAFAADSYEAADAGAGLVELAKEWTSLGRPRLERLRLIVTFEDASPGGSRTLQRGASTLRFGWAPGG